MSQVIPTFSTGTVKYNVSLNGATFFIRTYFNEFSKMWFLDLLDSDNNPVALGLALVPDINILRYSQQLTDTIGELRISTAVTGNDTTMSLGDDALLYYFTPGEFETLFPNFNTELFRTQQFDFSALFTVAP